MNPNEDFGRVILIYEYKHKIKQIDQKIIIKKQKLYYNNNYNTRTYY